MQKCPISDQSDTYNISAYVKHSYITGIGSHIKHGLNYPCKYKTLVIAETLTNVTFLERAQQVTNQTQIKGLTHMQVIKCV